MREKKKKGKCGVWVLFLLVWYHHDNAPHLGLPRLRFLRLCSEWGVNSAAFFLNLNIKKKKIYVFFSILFFFNIVLISFFYIYIYFYFFNPSLIVSLWFFVSR